MGPVEPRRRITDGAARPPIGDAVYTEADMAEARLEWERATKERELTTQLAQLAGTVATLPRQFEEIARRVFTEMAQAQLHEQNEKRDQRLIRFGQYSTIVQAVTALGMIWLAIHK